MDSMANMPCNLILVVQLRTPCREIGGGQMGKMPIKPYTIEILNKAKVLQCIRSEHK